MLDLEGIKARFNELDATARDVLAEDRKLSDHRTFWHGTDTTGRNLERLFRLMTAAELEDRIAKLEAELTTLAASDDVRDDTRGDEHDENAD